MPRCLVLRDTEAKDLKAQRPPGERGGDRRGGGVLYGKMFNASGEVFVLKCLQPNKLE